ncbi:BON domain-containing protein [candidate division KSB1 bacterium]|nr:BON domain-containing protein [candidate division KSB1 bacterium]
MLTKIGLGKKIMHTILIILLLPVASQIGWSQSSTQRMEKEIDNVIKNYFVMLNPLQVLVQENGVMMINDYLVVLPPPHTVSDDNLKHMLQDVLENRLLLDRFVTTTVVKGVVTVNGVVPTLWNKLKVEEEFLRILGVRHVKNNIKIRNLNN